MDNFVFEHRYLVIIKSVFKMQYHCYQEEMVIPLDHFAETGLVALS